MLESILLAVLVPLALLTLLLGYLVFTRRALRHPVPAMPAPPAPAVPETAEIERNKSILEDMLQSLSGRVESHSRSARDYGETLEHHREAIQHANSLRSMRDIEQLLVEEVDAMRKANEAYRVQLDTANKTIQQQREQLEALSFDATIDFLTQVLNRRAFDRHLHDEIERYRRGGPPFSLILVDIDHFKGVNDHHGHPAGDEVLRTVARLFDSHRRATDLVARFGGEEFALLMPCTGESQAAQAVEKLRALLEATPVQTPKARIKVTFSAGVAEMLPADRGPLTLIQRADDRLYRAKRNGRNVVVAQ